MIHPALALQEAVYNALSPNVDLASALGGIHIYDVVPTRQKPPYITFAECTHSDWSTGSENGYEHAIALNIWSNEHGRKQVLEIAELIVTSLDQLPQTHAGHVIVNFTHESTEVSRDEEKELFLAVLNFRAVTEPLPTNLQ